MFYRCLSLKELNLSNFNTDNVKNMTRIFFGCESLNALNLSNFKTNDPRDLCCMFTGCSPFLSLICTDNLTQKNIIYNIYKIKMNYLSNKDLYNFNFISL